MGQKQESQSLSAAEWEVMKPLWDRGPMAARDVYAALPPDNDGAPANGWAYRTVKTLLSRLVAKGALDYEQVGNAYLYRATVEQQAMALREVEGLVGRLRGRGEQAGSGLLGSVLAQFLGDARLSEEDLGHLESLLHKKRSEIASSSKKSGPRMKRGSR